MRYLAFCIVICAMAVVMTERQTRAQTLQMGVSVDLVPVASDFNGTDIVVFGSIEDADIIRLKLGHYQVVVTVAGAPEDPVVREKKRIFGIWINRNSKQYTRIPSFYSAVSRIPIDKIADRKVLRENQIGVQNLEMALQPGGNTYFISQAPEFSDALRRIRLQEGLFAEWPSNLVQLSPTLFRATVSLPPNVPIGKHVVTAHLFKNGELLAQTESSFRIEKIGLERWMYDLAHQNGLLYGIMAVLIAIGTGWLANTLFRKN